MKVLFLTNLPSPYRVEFFNQLSKYVDLHVLFENNINNERNTDWFDYDHNKFKSYYLNKNLLKLLNEINPDIVVNCNYSSLNGILTAFYSKLKRRIYLIEADGGIVIKRNKIIELAITYLFSLCDIFMSSSTYTDEYITYYKVPKSKIRHFHFSSLTRAEINKNSSNIYNSTSHNLELLYIGQIIHRKGLDILLKALENIKNVNLRIIGGLESNELKKIREELKLENVEYINFINKAELSEYYKTADAFILPSREEIWGLVLNEAISFNLPFISSTNCIAAKTFNDCGIIFENESINDLRNKIEEIKDKRLRDTLSSKCNLINKEYSIEKMVIDHMNVFNEITRGSTK